MYRKLALATLQGGNQLVVSGRCVIQEIHLFNPGQGAVNYDLSVGETGIAAKTIKSGALAQENLTNLLLPNGMVLEAGENLYLNCTSDLNIFVYG